jgi:hypothetical protein
MRGWEGEGPYPIHTCLVRSQGTIDILVSEKLSDIDRFTEEHEHIASLILDLPLLLYREEFIASVDESEGFTIRDRLDIVKMGENDSSYNSCIRLSSNWLAASVYKINEALGIMPEFDIEMLREIS